MRERGPSRRGGGWGGGGRSWGRVGTRVARLNKSEERDGRNSRAAAARVRCQCRAAAAAAERWGLNNVSMHVL